MKWWMSPDAAPQESTGTSDVKSMYDGRFIEATVSGMHMGQPFMGRQTMGYDNLKKEFTSTWIDNMATGMMSSSATYDAATKTFTESGNFSCPLKDGPMTYHALTKIIDDNTYMYEMYMPDKDGKEFKSMEITYKKK